MAVARLGTRGTALVEFALTAAVFFGMIFAIGDFALCMHAQDAATGAAQLAAATAARDDGTAAAGQHSDWCYRRQLRVRRRRSGRAVGARC
jgi:Flp pilus assembly protein TadG